MILVKTLTCGNCKIAEVRLKEAGFEFESVLANERMDLMQEFKIMQAPSLIVDNEVISGYPNILKYINDNK